MFGVAPNTCPINFACLIVSSNPLDRPNVPIALEARPLASPTLVGSSDAKKSLGSKSRSALALPIRKFALISWNRSDGIECLAMSGPICLIQP